MSVNEKMTNIAEAIRMHSNIEGPLTLDDMAAAIPDVWSAGQADGYAEGESYGLAEGEIRGRQAEYDEFWDMFQKNGSRTAYNRCFYGWDGSKLRPKYDIVIIGDAPSMFRLTTGIKSFPKHLEECGITFDSSKCTDFGDFFQGSQIEEIEQFDGSKSNNYAYMFSGCPKIKSIRNLKLNPQPSYGSPYSSMFPSSLETLIVEGGIGKKGFNVSHCTKLTHESLMSIINCLVDYSASGTTYTVTFGTTNLTKLTESEKAIATQKGWTLA